jgi:predicted DNA-binding transcriptional regulator AlpA
MRAFDSEKRLIGVHGLAVILDVSPESIYAKTSKKNRGNLSLEIPEPIDLGARLKKWRLPDVYQWIEDRRTKAVKNTSDARTSFTTCV